MLGEMKVLWLLEPSLSDCLHLVVVENIYTLVMHGLLQLYRCQTLAYIGKKYWTMTLHYITLYVFLTQECGATPHTRKNYITILYFGIMYKSLPVL